MRPAFGMEFKKRMDAGYWDYVFVAVTGFIAYHGLTFRDQKGEREFVHMLFGAIALLYCLWVLGSDILGIL